jgi:hypothetical protein
MKEGCFQKRMPLKADALSPLFPEKYCVKNK